MNKSIEHIEQPPEDTTNATDEGLDNQSFFNAPGTARHESSYKLHHAANAQSGVRA